MSVLTRAGKGAEPEALIDELPASAKVYNALAWGLVCYPVGFGKRKLAFSNPPLAHELATRAVELEPGNTSIWNTLGAARYRSGDWHGACAALEKSMQLRNRGDSFDWFFLAVAHWQLGNKHEARRWYDRAVQWMEKNKPRDGELLMFRAASVSACTARPTWSSSSTSCGRRWRRLVTRPAIWSDRPPLRLRR
jgi:tetratricopeptide (TPR) repeat protein